MTIIFKSKEWGVVMYKSIIYFIVFFIVFLNINVVISDTMNESAQTIDISIVPPNGTQIDLELSEYYNIPVATGINGTFWYVAQSWHTSEEIVNISTNIQMDGGTISDYDAFNDSKIPMPINLLLIVGLIGIMYYISNRIALRFP